MKRWVLGAAFLATTAFAYILPAGSILRRVAAKRDDLQLTTVTLKGSAVFYEGAAKELATALGVDSERPQVSTEVRVMMKFPGRCRMEVTSEESTKKVAQARNSSRSRTEGLAIRVLAEAVDETCAFLALRSSDEDETRQLLDRQLSALKVEYRKTSLSRFGGQVAYVLGNPAEGAPQFWVYKDSFLPARIRYKDAQGAQWDVRFYGYGSAAAEDAFPRTLEVAKDGKNLMRLTVADGVTSGSLEEKLF